MKKSIITILVCAILTNAYTQQLQTSSFYEMQGIMHNPAMAGMLQKGMIGATYRTQWSGISGSPKTATLFGSFELPAQKIGLGGHLYNDQTGPTKRTGIALSFAKHIPFQNGGKLSLGIEARGLQYSIDAGKLSQTLGADPVIGTNDNSFKFDAGFGIAYADKNWQLGVSVSQLVQSKLNFYEGTTATTEDGKLYRHYYFHGGYKWNVDGVTTITPNFLVTYLPNAPVELQGGVRLEHNELFWWGLSARLHQSFIISAGVNINKKFSIGYAFDIYKTPLSVFDAGSNSHEMMLVYNLWK